MHRGLLHFDTTAIPGLLMPSHRRSQSNLIRAAEDEAAPRQPFSVIRCLVKWSLNLINKLSTPSAYHVPT